MLAEIAIGDAYGSGFEFCPREKIERCNTLARYVEHERGIPAGHYTDDTQMSIAVAEALLADGDCTPIAFAEAFVRCYRRDPRQGYGTATQSLLEHSADGAQLCARAKPESRRNGAAMRSVPLGLLADKALLARVAGEQAALTHNTPEGVLSSRVVALMAHALLYEHTPLAGLTELIERETGFQLNDRWSGEVDCDAIQTVHAVCTALLRNRRMSNLLLDCIDFGGDVDSVAAIAMGLASLSVEYQPDTPPALRTGLEAGDYGMPFLTGLDVRLATKFPVLQPHLRRAAR